MQSPALGSTAKQISRALELDEELIASELAALETAGKALHFGRGLWLPSYYNRISSLKGFVSPEEYEFRFKSDYQKVSFCRLNYDVTFSSNLNRPVHRWSPYVQGFSADFVDQIIERYNLGRGDQILDCYSGSGTAPLCAKLKGVDAIGVDLSPLMTFVSKTKTRLESEYIRVNEVTKILNDLRLLDPKTGEEFELPFLKETHNQFTDAVLLSLFRLKASILAVEDDPIRDLLNLAFTSVLVGSSNLKRSPCLGYKKEVMADPSLPYALFSSKMQWIIADLLAVQHREEDFGKVEIYTADSASHRYKEESVDLTVTSPPYANGLDYITNYKIEMAWLGIANSYEDLRSLRDSMVACDNVSRGSLERYFDRRSVKVRDPWLDEILAKVLANTNSKRTFRRRDMHLVVKKYFEDMFDTFEKIYDALAPGGKFVFVVGDSLTAGVYLPTDLILAKIGCALGFEVVDVEFARNRRSGQRRDFKLRESIVTLAKQ